MRSVCIALCPALIAAIAIFGWRSLLLTGVSVLNCVLLEYLWCRLMKKNLPSVIFPPWSRACCWHCPSL